ncbi:MAG: hypothetical protein KDA32_08610, partial [Phycisphaerales bacterium]|nr:hypothetical protein [Phycisphaerales bacterium]
GWLLSTYAVGNLLGGGGFLIVARLNPPLAIFPLMMPIGALAAWAWWGWRNLRTDTVLVFSQAVRAGDLIAIIAAVYIGMTILGRGFGTVAWLAAIGCGIAAPALVDAINEWREGRAEAPARVARRPATRSISRERSEQPAPETRDDDIDDVLAKISREGMDALTDAERARLEAARQRKLHRPDSPR